MLGMTSVYNSKKHYIIGGEIGAYIEGLSKDSGRDLAVICYEDLQVFCIIEWMSPQKDVFIDILNLGKSLANFAREKAAELRRRLFQPISCDETSQYIAEGESTFHHDMQDWNSEETDRYARIERGE